MSPNPEISVSPTQTWPLPTRLASKLRRGWLRRFGGGGAVVLMYHRVCDLPEGASDPAELVTPVALFEEHLAVFSEQFSVLPLREVVTRFKQRQSIPTNTLCLTFDDGYQDIFTVAQPLLKCYQCPGTVFVSTLGLDSSQHYAWEEHAPELYAHVDASTLQKFADDKWLDIGGHTHSHPQLTELSTEAQRSEIAQNRDILTELCGKAPPLFAYPFGMPERDWDETTAQLVRESGYEAACSINYGMLSRASDLFAIPRFDVHNMPTEQALAYLKDAFGL